MNSAKIIAFVNLIEKSKMKNTFLLRSIENTFVGLIEKLKMKNSKSN